MMSSLLLRLSLLVPFLFALVKQAHGMVRRASPPVSLRGKSEPHQADSPDSLSHQDKMLREGHVGVLVPFPKDLPYNSQSRAS